MLAPQLAENSIARVKLVIGRMPGTIGTVMPAARGALDEAQIGFAVEEELADRAGGPGVDLALQIVQVVLRAGRLRVAFRIGRHADLEIGDALQAFHQIGGIGVAARIGLVGGADARRRIAAQRHDMADAAVPIGPGDGVDLFAGGADAGQVGGGPQAGFLLEPADGRSGCARGSSLPRRR